MVTISASTKLWAFAMAEQFEKHGMLDELITTFAYSKNTFARHFIKRKDKEEIPVDKIETNLLLALPGSGAARTAGDRVALARLEQGDQLNNDYRNHRGTG